MNNTHLPEDVQAGGGREEIMSALFAHMVIQQTNMALMLLGKTPHPETGQTMQDLESARLFIDQMEMLEFKTRGNLDKEEEKLLKQSLTALRMAFVESIDDQAGQPRNSPSAPAREPAKSSEPAGPPVESGQPASPPGEDESRKKFTKKY